MVESMSLLKNILKFFRRKETPVEPSTFVKECLKVSRLGLTVSLGYETPPLGDESFLKITLTCEKHKLLANTNVCLQWTKPEDVDRVLAGAVKHLAVMIEVKRREVAR